MLRRFGRKIGLVKPTKLEKFKENDFRINLSGITQNTVYADGKIERWRNPKEKLSEKASISTFYNPDFVFDLAKFYFDNINTLTAEEKKEINEFFKELEKNRESNTKIPQYLINDTNDIDEQYNNYNDFYHKNKKIMENYAAKQKKLFEDIMDNVSQSGDNKEVTNIRDFESETGGKKLKKRSPTKKRRHTKKRRPTKRRPTKRKPTKKRRHTKRRRPTKR